MATLDDKTHAEIVALAREGDALVKDGFGREAIRRYVQALDLLPEPFTEWEAATWLFSAIGDAYWLLGNYELAAKAFRSAVHSPGGLGNPFIHLRLGQLEYEFGHTDRAADELMRAYMGGDRKIFEGEDPKYFDVISDLI